ncbi:hypothetical protein [Methanoplanus endosymbiosus]|uniref:Uncharacterized protein n=1 Tax=Methanoplanus endosymbiosus TaxID=33865 RepID=A0A9E7PKQ0_9EURY|nr:hypothetical protein [Methanoplanus endosymbiosus]UUX91943.1 hypothetical protein L6E24_11330 [Methanoplanus endosymbiosus]
MPKRSGFIIIITIAFVVFLTAASGCTTGTENKNDDGMYSQTFSSTITLPEQHYRQDGTCYWVSDIMITNNGLKDEKNVVVRCSLKEADTGTVSDTETKYYELFPAGENKGFTVELDGDCGKNYGVGVNIKTEDK